MENEVNNILMERDKVLIECDTLKKDNYKLKRLNENNIKNYQKQLEIMESSIRLKSESLEYLEKLLKQRDEEKTELINLNNKINDEDEFKKNEVSITCLYFEYFIVIVNNRLLLLLF